MTGRVLGSAEFWDITGPTRRRFGKGEDLFHAARRADGTCRPRAPGAESGKSVSRKAVTRSAKNIASSRVECRSAVPFHAADTRQLRPQETGVGSLVVGHAPNRGEP
jgi:hypothetical protein